MNQKKIISFLKWYLESGVNEAIDEKPKNRIEKIASEPKISSFIAPNHKFSSENIYKNLTSCKTLNEIKLLLSQFDGCSLKYTANKLVFGEGSHLAKIMLVGEGPGAEEDHTGIPFVGEATKSYQLPLGIRVYEYHRHPLQ